MPGGHTLHSIYPALDVSLFLCAGASPSLPLRHIKDRIVRLRMPGQNLQVQFLILISADPCAPVLSHVKTELTVTVPASQGC